MSFRELSFYQRIDVILWALRYSVGGIPETRLNVSGVGSANIVITRGAALPVFRECGGVEKPALRVRRPREIEFTAS